MKTRIFKALYSTREYLRIVKKVAIYNDQGEQVDCRLIEQDNDGREWYSISNPFDKFGSFTDKPKDALECIKNGIGDAMALESFFGMNFVHVKRYVDRKYGENIRQQTLKGWEDTEFAYAIKVAYMYSFSSGNIIGRNNILSYYDDITNALKFDTEEAANEHIRKLEKMLEDWFDEYKNLKGLEARKDFIKEKRKNTIYTLFFSFAQGKERNDPYFKFEVIQVTK
nr:MAG TPA: hypothetical protein [Caudoviricetes sp.]